MHTTTCNSAESEMLEELKALLSSAAKHDATLKYRVKRLRASANLLIEQCVNIIMNDKLQYYIDSKDCCGELLWKDALLEACKGGHNSIQLDLSELLTGGDGAICKCPKYTGDEYDIISGIGKISLESSSVFEGPTLASAVQQRMPAYIKVRVDNSVLTIIFPLN